MKSIEGFKDRFGVELRRHRFLVDASTSVAESFGYEPISVPIVERAEAYDQEIVGLSPWPEWNPNGCFFFDIDNYTSSYDVPNSKTAAVLIPEGTLSVTRWLGAQLDGKNDRDLLPLKIYYDLQCFRNELTSTLSATKGRSFSQFGSEVLGSDKITADIEPMVMAHEILLTLGVDHAKVMFRISSNELFLSMAAATGLSDAERVELKEQLDTIAECKAGKKPERLENTIKAFWEIIHGSPERNHDGAWAYLIDRSLGAVTLQDRNILDIYGTATLDRISAIAESLNAAGILCEVDYCVVRSHEYYTGVTFEIDLVGERTRYVEVGGGGRYDRLLGNFTPPDGPKSVPCVGFAFGIERLQAALVAEGLLSSIAERPNTTVDLTENSTVLRHRIGGDERLTEFEEASRYLNSVSEFRSQRQDSRVSVDL